MVHRTGSKLQGSILSLSRRAVDSAAGPTGCWWYCLPPISGGAHAEICVQFVTQLLLTHVHTFSAIEMGAGVSGPAAAAPLLYPELPNLLDHKLEIPGQGAMASSSIEC
jgi:hypothetical protein